jgi:hypothetical protein
MGVLFFRFESRVAETLYAKSKHYRLEGKVLFK